MSNLDISKFILKYVQSLHGLLIFIQNTDFHYIPRKLSIKFISKNVQSLHGSLIYSKCGNSLYSEKNNYKNEALLIQVNL